MKRWGKRTWVFVFGLGIVLLCICVAGGLFLPSPRPSQEILETMSAVCGGKSVEEAGAFNPGPGPHAIVLLDASGNEHPWNELLPYEWWPQSVNETELVACLQEEQLEFVDTCEYSGGHIVKRYQYTTPIRLMAARTGENIASGVVTGEPPRACKLLEMEITTEIHGDHVKDEDVEQWLQEFVSP